MKKKKQNIRPSRQFSHLLSMGETVVTVRCTVGYDNGFYVSILNELDQFNENRKITRYFPDDISLDLIVSIIHSALFREQIDDLSKPNSCSLIGLAERIMLRILYMKRMDVEHDVDQVRSVFLPMDFIQAGTCYIALYLDRSQGWFPYILSVVLTKGVNPELLIAQGMFAVWQKRFSSALYDWPKAIGHLSQLEQMLTLDPFCLDELRERISLRLIFERHSPYMTRITRRQTRRILH